MLQKKPMPATSSRLDIKEHQLGQIFGLKRGDSLKTDGPQLPSGISGVALIQSQSQKPN
jgi:hypothetical protein